MQNMESSKHGNRADPAPKLALSGQTLEDAQLHAVPTSTGHEVLGTVGHENISPAVLSPSTRPDSFSRWVLTVFSLKSSPYFALYGRVPGKRPRTILILAIFLPAAAGVPLPVIGFLFGKIINSFPPPEDELRERLTQLIGVALAYFVITWGWAVCWGTIGEMISRELRKALVEKLLGMV